MNVTDDHERFAEWDGAYVLGALEPLERQAYERHLTTCARCSAAVSELAGLPGMLSRVPLDSVVSEPEPAPITLLPAMARRTARDRRRRRVLTGLAAAAAVLVAAVLGAVLGATVWSAVRPATSLGAGSPPSSSTPSVAQQPMAVLVKAPITATAAVQTTPWGTKVSMRCDHGGGKPESGEWYMLWVVARDGRQERIASWTPAQGKVAVIEGDTWLPKADISFVEVRAANGLAVLRLSV